MSIRQSLSWKLTAEVTAPEPELLFDDLIQSGIIISSLQKQTDLVYRFRIHPGDYRRMSRITQKRGGHTSIVGRQGLYWKIRSAGKHPVLLGLVCLLSFLSLFLPTRVLLIEVSGNQTVTTNRILEAAADCGIRFAARRDHVRSEKVKNELLSVLPQLQWAGINTAGCRAVISVKEGKRTEPEAVGPFISDLVAEQDAYILSSTVTSGTAMVQPGDIVLKGQVLISGYTDCGSHIRAGRAFGEILARTNHSTTAIMPANYSGIREITDTKYKISLIIGKKRIILWKDSRISDTGCGRMYAEYFVSLPGGYRLPMAVAVDRYDSYAMQTIAVPETDALKSLENFSDTCLTHQMTAGQILRKQQQFELSEGVYTLKSDYRCTEIIGWERREQIGDRNGERN